jgi:hypothetical protein
MKDPIAELWLSLLGLIFLTRRCLVAVPMLLLLRLLLWVGIARRRRLFEALRPLQQRRGMCFQRLRGLLVRNRAS